MAALIGRRVGVKLATFLKGLRSVGNQSQRAEDPFVTMSQLESRMKQMAEHQKKEHEFLKIQLEYKIESFNNATKYQVKEELREFQSKHSKKITDMEQEAFYLRKDFQIQELENKLIISEAFTKRLKMANWAVGIITATATRYFWRKDGKSA